MNIERKLHIGGQVRAEGWEVIDSIPGACVDHVGDAADLSRFADGSFAAVYASHVIEHFDYAENRIVKVLSEWCRVLRPRGVLYVSAPDLDMLARLFLAKEHLNVQERFQVMRLIFGGHINQWDYHLVGLNQEFLGGYLQAAGFGTIQRTEDFGLFSDTSRMQVKGVPISVNLIAHKPAA